MRVAVIGGGRSCEHDVSLASASAAAGALAQAGHEVVALTIGTDGAWWSDGRPVDLPGAVRLLRGCDVALPLLHGPHGEDGTLAALCALADVRHVGSPLGAAALAMDKHATKLLAASVGIATAPGVLLTAAGAEGHAWTHPVVVKPVASGSSHGVALVEEPGALAPALDAALALDDRVLVEDVVLGREVDVVVLGRADGSRVVAPALEVVVDPDRGVFDLDTKYDGSADFRVPAALSPEDAAALEHAALVMYDALGCRGVARVDFFLTTDGPVLNEVNTTPGFTEHSQVPRMFAAAGTTYVELVDLLVRDAVA